MDLLEEVCSYLGTSVLVSLCTKHRKSGVQFRTVSDTTADNDGFTMKGLLLNHCKVHEEAAYPFPTVMFPSCLSAVESKTCPVIRDHEEIFVHGLTETSSIQLW